MENVILAILCVPRIAGGIKALCNDFRTVLNIRCTRHENRDFRLSVG